MWKETSVFFAFFLLNQPHATLESVAAQFKSQPGAQSWGDVCGGGRKKTNAAFRPGQFSVTQKCNKTLMMKKITLCRSQCRQHSQHSSLSSYRTTLSGSIFFFLDRPQPDYIQMTAHFIWKFRSNLRQCTGVGVVSLISWAQLSKRLHTHTVPDWHF